MFPITSIKQLNNNIYNLNNTKCHSSSSDSENNSHGTGSHDSVFEIESMSTCEEENVSLPSKCCKITISNVQNCCNYSNENIYLLKNTNIISVNVNTYHQREITNNRSLIDVVSYNGYLYGLDKKGNLYTLCNDYYHNTYWVWKKVCWAPKNIKHINATLNHETLLIQTEKKNYLFDINYNKKKIKIKGTRIYGNDETCYLDFYHGHCYVYVNYENMKIFNNVSTGAMDNHHDIFLINQGSCQKVRIINYEPFYY